jgi:hypothetical protein
MLPPVRGIHVCLGQVAAQGLELGHLALRSYIAARTEKGPRWSIYMQKFQACFGSHLVAYAVQQAYARHNGYGGRARVYCLSTMAMQWKAP